MASFSLTAIFGVDATGVKTEIKQLRKELNSFVNDYAKLGAGIAVGVFVALSKGALDLASNLKDLAAQLGINVEKLQVLQYAAEQNGSSTDEMNKSLEKLRLNTQAAVDGNQAYIDALTKLGLKTSDLIGLPLEQKYERVAKAYSNSTDKAVAYNAVSELFGAKIGPKMIETLDNLAKDGFEKTAKAAAAAGQIMSAETIVALERADQAIQDFKKKATISVGNILVNFRSEEGLKLMGLQLLRAAGKFGATILDGIIEAGGMVKAILWGELQWVGNKFRDLFLDNVADIARAMNKILPENFQINVDGIEALKSAGKDLGQTISDAIAKTEPSTFAKDVTEYWDKAISDQQKVVDSLNKVDLKPDADKLRNAGKALQDGGTNAAKALEDAGDKVKKDLAEAAKKAAEAFSQAGESLYQQTKLIFDRAAKVLQPLGAMNGASMAQLDENTLKEIVRQNQSKKQGLQRGSAFDIGDDLELARLDTEIANAQRELDLRRRFQSDLALRGVEGARGNYDPLIYEKLLRQFGPGSSANPEAKKQTDLLAKIAEGQDSLLEEQRRNSSTLVAGFNQLDRS